jgi:YidC/Oxa1 family membrane protein insertase
MDKLKLFNLFVLAFLLSLSVQYLFFPQAKQGTVQSTDIVLSVAKDAVTIPNIPVIELQNNSTGSFTLQLCEDMSMNIDSITYSMSGAIPAFCTPLEVASGTKVLLPMKDLYQVFANKSGKYVITLKTPVGDRTVFFTMESPGVFRTFLSTFVYQPIYNLFVALITFLPGHSLWWAIIIVTLIIRLILLVPQHHMLESQKKLQKIQPKIKALQKEYKWDQAQLGMKMMELYKAEWVNPMGSIVPLLIQMPILIGLYWVISEINDPSNFYHLYRFFAEFNPTEISTFFYGLHLDSVGGVIGIIFAIALGVLQWIQAKLSFAYTKKKTPKQEEIAKKTEGDIPDALDPELMQKMMLYFFPLMIGVTAYFFPLGVGLYWFIGTLFVIAQQAYVNQKDSKKSHQ